MRVDYWTLVDPIWEKVSIYDGPDTFLRQFHASPEASRTLFAAHWCQSEINNGGFGQFFSNSTGVLAPEAAQAFRAIGMPQTAAALEQAMALFGAAYPRDRTVREEALEAIFDASDDEEDCPFFDIEDTFFDLLNSENDGFEAAANRYAAAQG